MMHNKHVEVKLYRQTNKYKEKINNFTVNRAHSDKK